MVKRMLLATIGIGFSVLTSAQTTPGADTTSVGYKVGYQIGSWLPFVIIIGIALLIVLRSFDFSSFRKK